MPKSTKKMTPEEKREAARKLVAQELAGKPMNIGTVDHLYQTLKKYTAELRYDASIGNSSLTRSEVKEELKKDRKIMEACVTLIEHVYPNWFKLDEEEW